MIDLEDKAARIKSLNIEGIVNCCDNNQPLKNYGFSYLNIPLPNKKGIDINE